MKQAADVLIQLDLAAELVEQVGLRGGGIELDTGTAGQILGQGFAELTQLDQGGVGIAGEDLLGCARKLQENGVVFLEKGEVTTLGYVPSLEVIPRSSGLGCAMGGMMPERCPPGVLGIEAHDCSFAEGALVRKERVRTETVPDWLRQRW